MAKVVYRPKRGGKFIAPALKPGAELEVSHREAQHLVKTGAFEHAGKEAEPLEATPLAGKPAARKGGKETK